LRIAPLCYVARMAQQLIGPWDRKRVRNRKVTAMLTELGKLPADPLDRPNFLHSPAYVANKLGAALGVELPPIPLYRTGATILNQAFSDAYAGGGETETAIILDFTTGTFTLDGEAVALEDVLESNAAWSSDALPTIIPDVAMIVTSVDEGAVSAAAALTAEAAAAYQDGYVVVAFAQLGVLPAGTTSLAHVSFGIQDPDGSAGWYVDLECRHGSGDPLAEWEAFDNDELFETFEREMPQDGTIRAALRFASDGLAISVNGSANDVAAPPQALTGETRLVGLNMTANASGESAEATAGIQRLEIYPLSRYEAADLPTLSAL